MTIRFDLIRQIKYPRLAVLILAILVVFLLSTVRAVYASVAGEHVITVHDEDEKIGFYTNAKTVGDALKQAGISIGTNDRTEPDLNTELEAGSYEVNIYRARPVKIHDGSSERKVLSAYRTPRQVVEHAGMKLQAEDIVELAPSRDAVLDGIAEVLTIDRALGFTFDFYGKTDVSYTQATTVGDMLKQKNITLGPNDVIIPDRSTPMQPGMLVKLYRNGKQTITQDEEVKFEVEQIKDMDKDITFKEIRTPGENGKRTVTYEIVMQNGIEVSRKEVNSTVTKHPVKQVEVVGGKRPPVAGPAEILDKIHAVSAAKKIDGNRVAAIAKCESGFNPNADSGYYKGLFQHDPTYWPARAAKYGFSGASIFDVDAQIEVSTSMMAAGGWSHWGCKG